jgi:hypothetical protein
MPTRFQVSREDHSPNHPTGWVPIAMFGSLRKAELHVSLREAANRWAYSEKNPERLYHLIEAC